jgi:hypothetical protein
MAQYRIRVQIVTWYEMPVQAQSPEEAIARVEAMRPHQIAARGVATTVETGLADPESIVEGE